jgi:hypothetical protein
MDEIGGTLELGKLDRQRWTRHHWLFAAGLLR